MMKIGKEKKALILLDEAELYAFGAELSFCRIVILFSLKKRKEALGLLQKALKGKLQKARFNIQNDYLRLKERQRHKKNDIHILNLKS